MRKRLLAIVLSVLVGTGFSAMGFTVSAAAVAATLTSASGTATGYPTLQDAVNAAADGGIITLNKDVTESVTYTGTAGKTVTIDGQGHTVTGLDGDVSDGGLGIFALEVSGSGTLKLKDITLTGGANASTAPTAGIGANETFTGTVADLGAVKVVGGAGDTSCGLYCAQSSTGTIDVTEALGADGYPNTSFGILAMGSGTINATKAQGGNVTGDHPSSMGVANFGTGTVNVDTAIGGSSTKNSCGVFAINACVNSNSAVGGNITAQNGSSVGVSVINGIANVGTALCGTYNGDGSGCYAVETNSSSAVLNVGTARTTHRYEGSRLNVGDSAVRSIVLNAGRGATCVLETITVAGSGSTTIGTLPGVYKNSTAGSWFSDKTLKTAFSAATVDSQPTALYSSFYRFTVSGKITGSDEKTLAATLQLKNGGANIGAPVTANANGTYSLSDLPVGDGYTIAVSADGYTSGVIGPFNITGSDLSSGLDLQLAKIATNDSGKTNPANTSKTGNPKTGDNDFSFLPLIALAVASLSAFLVIKARKADKKKS